MSLRSSCYRTVLAVPHVVIISVLSVWAAAAADRAALWNIVHDQCVVAARSGTDPAPCAFVETYMGSEDGYAVLKDLVGDEQFLLIPTKRMSGIEAPELVAPHAPNYWQAAWEARRFVNLKLQRNLPRTLIAMAVNSLANRTQDQLHIHIDCAQPEVISLLAKHGDEIGEEWRTLSFTLVGRYFVARRVSSPDLEDIDPFKLLYSFISEAREDMSKETLVVIGATFSDHSDGFVLLSEKATTVPRSGHGEDLLDHTCAARDDAR